MNTRASGLGRSEPGREVHLHNLRPYALSLTRSGDYLSLQAQDWNLLQAIRTEFLGEPMQPLLPPSRDE